MTPNASGKTYGSSDPLLTGTLSGFLAADGVTAAYGRTAGETVGTYTIGAALGPGGVLSNYNITYNTASFIIGPKAASVTIDAKTKTLGSPDPDLTGTLSGFLAADGVSATYSRVPGETAGTYAISAALSPAEVLGNYSITNTGANLTIEKYFFDVCAGTNCSGGSNPNSNGIGGKLTINASIPYLGSGTAAVTLAPATLAGKDALTSPGMDAGVPLPPQFKVWIASNDNPSSPILSWSGNASQTAGPVSGMNTWSAGIPVTLTSAFLPGHYTAYVYGNDAGSLTSNTVPVNDGYSKPDTDNFKYPTLTVALAVVKAEQAITFDALSGKTYGDADFSVGATASSGLTVSFSAAGKCTVAGTTVHITGAGSCTITASQAGDNRYNAAPNGDQVFAIDPKPASVTPNAANKTYGDADPAFTGSLSGFLAGDGVTATYSRTAGETVGGSPYTISATLSPAGVLGNYAITYNTAGFTINRKSASVRPNAAGKTYGSSNPSLTGTMSGFLDADGVTAAYSRTAGETVAASPYSISRPRSRSSPPCTWSVRGRTQPHRSFPSRRI